jgi:2-oxoglutarate dehydrogenase E2 component (dihydrolipoamide succinyltransferase)
MAAPAGGTATAKEATSTNPATATAAAGGGKPSPAAKRVLEENHIETAAVAGSGRDGRVSKADVLNYLATKESAVQPSASAGPAARAAPGVAAPSVAAPGVAAPVAVAPTAPTSAAPIPKAPAPAAPAMPSAPIAGTPTARGARADERVPMTRLRARIAERMVQAQATQALLTSFNEVDLKAVNDLRGRYKEQFEKRHGVKLGFMSFFTRACVEALKRFPSVNASVEGTDIVYHDYFDVGVAVSTDRGLIVPILRDADRSSFAEIEKSIANFAGRARAGTITMEELTGGTFTITNGGTFGSLLSTPIVNSPQSAILGMHKIEDRAVVIDGQIVVRPMMYVALTYDHRIIDGREAVQFLVTVKQCLEDPARMVLGL